MRLVLFILAMNVGGIAAAIKQVSEKPTDDELTFLAVVLLVCVVMDVIEFILRCKRRIL